MKSILKIVVVLTAIIGGGNAAAECVSDETLGDYADNSKSCYKKGKKHGQWELRYANGNVGIGPFVNGKKHGKWEVRLADGEVQAGPYVNGKQHGRWEVRLADGKVYTGPYVNGKQHGQWEERNPNGDVATGPFVNDKRHGQWEVRLADGFVGIGPYVNGKQHGRWEMRHVNGNVSTGLYVNDKQQGQWEMRLADSSFVCMTFKNSEKISTAKGRCKANGNAVAKTKPSAKTTTETPPANTAATVFDSAWRTIVYIESGKVQGSGVIVGRNKVATNCHVVKKGTIKLFPPHNRNATANKGIPAKIIHRDEKRDFCLLQVPGVGGRVAKIRRYSTLKVGEQVYALGAPKGQELTLTDGLISQLRAGKGKRLIQTSAAISGGSSGGGLFDANGNLIGITTSILKGENVQNINFAIPAELALGK